MDLQISNLERQNSIHAFLKENKRVGVTTLCKIFSISEATVRRDLEALAAEGKIQRIRGGAILIEKSSPELPILEREHQQSTEKEHIGKAAVRLISDGETIFLGSGTTILSIARQLPNYKNLTILTNSLPIINTLVGHPGINLVILGGILRESEFSFIGHITEEALSEVRADKIFMSARAISLEQGVTNDYTAETLTDRAIIHIGQKVILAADHSKFGSISTSLLAPISDFDIIITDKGIDHGYVQTLEEKGITVILA